ncbi:MAG: SdrD B-like domain-containing protein [Bacteroidota bacterium]
MGSYLMILFCGFPALMFGQHVLFISDSDVGSMSSGDQAIYNRLSSQGYTITTKGSPSYPASTADAAGKDVVFISSTINSGDIGTMYKDVTIPVIVSEPWLLDDMKMVDDDGSHQGSSSSQTQMTIDLPSHPLVEGLSGTVTVLSPSESIRWGKPNSNCDKIARVQGSSDEYGVFCYRPGASMEGMTAPAYRIGFFLDDNTAANLTNDGWAIFDNTIRMSTGSQSSSPHVVRTCDVLNYGSSGRVFWIPLPGHDSGDERLYKFISGGQFVEYSDGSATIEGIVENLDDNSYKWDVSMRFVNKKNWTMWSALGRLAKNAHLGDETTWDYFEMDGTSSKMEGLGGFAGKTLYLSNNPSDFTYGLQVGMGANAMNAAYGLSQWFYFHGSYSGYGDINAEASCQNPPQPCASNVLAYWDLDACAAWSNSGDFSEFTPTYPYSSACQSVAATNVFRNNSSGSYGHSCNPGVDGDPAICISSSTGCTFTDNSNYALRFEVTVTPNSGASGTLSGLSFYEKSPHTWIQYNSSGTGFNNGTNNPPSKYGVRVTVNGTEVFKQVDLMTTSSWSLENIDFSSDPDFTVTTTTTFKFELLPYCTINNGGNLTAWDVDEIKILGCAETGALGDFVWHDSNRDGIQDSGETGVQNVQVRLYECENNGQPGTPGANDYLAETTTDANGYYLFSCLDASKDYYVELVTSSLPSDYELTTQDAGGDEAKDSDGDANGQTVCYDVPEGDTIPDVDFGIRKECELLDGGTVEDDQENCGPFDPDPLTNVTLPENGLEVYEYEWLYSLDKNLPFEMWISEPNSNSPDFDPPFVDKTCWLVRCARRVGCTERAYSNVIKITVKTFPKAEFTVPGGVCNATSTTLTAETANGNIVTYSWTFQNGNPPSALGQSVQVSWNNPGTYDITLSVDRFGCVSDLTQPIMIDNCGVCDNITGGGSINGGDVTCITPFDPDPLTNNNLPSTGTGALEFLWLKTTDPSLPQNQWTQIPNSNSQDYDPGPISETTYFLRCVRRAGCTSYRESNSVVIEVVEGAHSLCKPLNFDMGNGDFAIELDIMEGTTSGKYYFSENERKFVVYTDGTALLEGKLIHSENSNQRWDAEIWFKDYKDWGEWRAMGGEQWPGNFNFNKRTWDYYEIDASKSTLTGKQWFKNKVINLAQHAPSASERRFQVGAGANRETGEHGAYGEFSYTGDYSGNGKIKISFEECQDVCTPTPKVAIKTVLQAAYNPSTGEMNTALANNNMLPATQPFGGYPWNYNGGETIAGGSDISDIVDWGLLEIIDASTSVTVMKEAVLLDKTGLLREASNASSLVELDGLDPDASYYINVCFRNHLDIGTQAALSRMGRVLDQDFNQAGAAYTTAGMPNPPMITLSDGTVAQFSGDVNGDGVINSLDYSQVISVFFLFQYLSGDTNLDMVINSLDLANIVGNYFKFGITR